MEIIGGLVAFRGINRHGPFDDRGQPLGDFGIALAERGQLGVVHRPRQPVFGDDAAQRGVQGRAERVNVGARIGARRAVLFGRGIAGRHGARPGGGGLAALHHLGEAEVHQEDVAVGGDLDVAGFQVAMQDGRLARVQVVERVAHGRADQDRLVLADRAGALHALAQVFAFDVVHHQVLALVADHKMVGNARQVGMPQVRQDDRLEAELARVLIGGEEVFLERDFHAQVLIHGAINRSHAALAEDLDNAIAFVQQCAAFKCHEAYALSVAIISDQPIPVGVI